MPISQTWGHPGPAPHRPRPPGARDQNGRPAPAEPGEPAPAGRARPHDEEEPTIILPTPTPSSSPTPTPTPTGNIVPSLSTLSQQLTHACGANPDTLCRSVYDVTHSEYIASGAQIFLATPAKIIFVLVLALVSRTVVNRFITRATRRAANGGGGPGIANGRARTAVLGAFGDPTVLLERRRQRAETVGSIARSITSIVVFGIAFVTVLGELGINLAPIVASAGVIGLAVGFGAQNLVKDFLSGIFMLLEDQYGVGDVIDVGPATGTVESVSLRTTRLRDVEGSVWYVRNGEITRVANKSQTWSRAVLDIPLTYDTDVSQARDVLKRTADEVWADPRWAAVVIEEPEVWGVEEMSADGYIIRMVVKTLPTRQGDLARELRERIRSALLAEGIELGTENRQEITVHSDDGDEADGPASGDDEDEFGGAASGSGVSGGAASGGAASGATAGGGGAASGGGAAGGGGMQ
ncbi:MAG: mechanosensitive ion channel family protein [Frankia sp.]